MLTTFISQEVAIRSGAIPGFLGKLQIAYEHANSSDHWQETYALTRMQEYFAQGVESYFATSKYPNGHENMSSEAQINTRHKLEKRDPLLYYLIKEIFPCENIYHQRCDKGTVYTFR